MATRKRSGSGSKRPKEKVVYIYELLLHGANADQNKQNFWDEFFLLQPNTEAFESELQKLDSSKLCAAKSNLLLLLEKCVDIMDVNDVKRTHNALITLSILTYTMFKKYSNSEDGSVENMFAEFRLCDVEEHIKKLVEKIKELIICDNSDTLRFYCLKLLFIVGSGTDNLDDNLLLEYIMSNNLFDSLKKVLSDSTARLEHGHDIVILLALLVNYRKHDATNPYVVKLSLLDDELALHG